MSLILEFLVANMHTNYFTTQDFFVKQVDLMLQQQTLQILWMIEGEKVEIKGI